MARDFFRQLRGEVYRMFARKRTYIGFGAFVVLDGAVLYFLQKPPVQRFYETMLGRNGFPFEDYFSALTLGLIVLVVSCLMLGALFLSLVAGDIVGKEMEDGTLRMILCRPVTRFRLLLTKYVASLIYTVCLVFFLGISALVMGFIERGWGGGLFVFAPEHGVFAVHPFGEGLRLYLFSLVFISLSLMTVTSLAFLFSCQRMKPAAAAILTVAIFFIDFVLANMPPLQPYREWFLTQHTSKWVHLFAERIPWPELAQNYALLIGIDVTCFLLAWMSFQVRDLKS